MATREPHAYLPPVSTPPHRRSALVRALVLLSMALPPAMSARAQPVTDDQLQRQLSELEKKLATRPDSGLLTSIRYLADTARRIDGRYATQARSWRRTASRYIARALAGEDPYSEEKGRIVNRGYASELSRLPQGYAVYIPPGYDASRAWPLMVVLHGGSSNGNLFLGVVLGNNMSWKHYSQYLWNDFEPRWHPNVIVVAPDGFGQVMWRWMGEQDVLDVIEDVQRHYRVDPNRITLAGLSNGGVGAYALGTRHAWRFNVVQAIAGAPSWIQYTAGRPRAAEQRALQMVSGLDLIENSLNTDFRFYHGRTDTGPMRPAFVTALERHMEKLGLTPNVTWYDAGHDILYRVHRHGRTFDSLASRKRDPKPERVRVVTSDYRASRQHWLTVTGIDRYPSLADVSAEVRDKRLTVRTRGAHGLALAVRDSGLPTQDDVSLQIDDQEVYRGPLRSLGHVAHVFRQSDRWQLGFLPDGGSSLRKRAGLSGPLTDAYYDRTLHVYGTQRPDHVDDLRRAAEKGAQGWPLWLWRFRQEVVADTELTEAMMKRAHIVLYTTPGANAVFDRIADRLPLQIGPSGVTVGNQRFEAPGVGTRFIYPNPLAPKRYVVVQGGSTPAAVQAGHRLPDFLPDWVVYDGRTTRSRARLITGSNRPLALGYFTDRWQLPEPSSPSEGSVRGDPPLEGGQEQPLGVRGPPALQPGTPAVPPPPRRFSAPAADPAGAAARRIARRAAGFRNYRGEIPRANWTVNEDLRWDIGRQNQCYARLQRAGLPFRPSSGYPTPVPSPVEILGPVAGVWFRMVQGDQPLSISCELALRLPSLAKILRRHGVRGVDLMSAYRNRPRTSFHTFGLALDISRFWTQRGWLSVLSDFQESPNQHTCDHRPTAPRARTLLAIACDLWRSGLFSSVLTPNYNAGHRDHFHVDARPNDPRKFLR